MDIKVIKKKVLSSDGKHYLKGKVYVPDCEIKGIFQVVHGMTEHIGRYDLFMREIAEEGYICFGYDHLGHGETVDSDDELGFIAYKKGYELLVYDVYSFAHEVRSEYGENLPYYLLGHSMGSFIVRLASAYFPHPDKLIIMGTGGPNPMSKLGLFILKTDRLLFGDKHISKFSESLMFGSFNNHFGKDNKYNWLSTDSETKEKYANDKFCTFHFTVSALIDLVTLNFLANKKEWFKEINKEMPILLVSGADDPVGNYGKGVKKVYQKLKALGSNVKIKLYLGARHEILNDFTHKDTVKDILDFIK